MNDPANRLGMVAGFIGIGMMILGHNVVRGATDIMFWAGAAFVLVGIVSLRSSRPKGG